MIAISPSARIDVDSSRVSSFSPGLCSNDIAGGSNLPSKVANLDVSTASDPVDGCDCCRTAGSVLDCGMCSGAGGVGGCHGGVSGGVRDQAEDTGGVAGAAEGTGGVADQAEDTGGVADHAEDTGAGGVTG